MPVAPSSYNPLIPQPTDQLSVSQGNLLLNFGALTSWIDQNHVDSSSGSPQAGKHTWVQMPVQTGSPNGGFLSGEGALFTQTSAVTSNPELVFARGTATPYEITTQQNGQTYSFAPYSGASNINMTYGWTRLPSGLIMLFAYQTNANIAIGPSGSTIAFPSSSGSGFPGFSVGLFNVQVTLQTTSGSSGIVNSPLCVVQGSYSTASFVVTIASNGDYGPRGSLSYLAIGM